MPIAVMLPTVEQLKGSRDHGSPTAVFFQYPRQCKFYLAYTVYATWQLLSIPVCEKPTAFYYKNLPFIATCIVGAPICLKEVTRGTARELDLFMLDFTFEEYHQRLR